MEFKIQNISYFRRLFLKTSLVYLLIVFLLIDCIVFFTNEVDWQFFLFYNGIIFIPFLLFLIQSIVFSKLYITKIALNNDSVVVNYKYFCSDRIVTFELDNLFISVKNNRFVLSKVRTYRIQFASKLNGNFRVVLRQFQLGDWDFEKMKNVRDKVDSLRIKNKK